MIPRKPAATTTRTRLPEPAPTIHSPCTVQSHEVLQEAFDKISPKEVAQTLGVSLSLVYKWAQAPGEGGSGGVANPLDRAAELIALTKHPAIIKWLCRTAGGYYVRNPSRHQDDGKGLVPLTNEILQQFADLLGAITDAAADHRISPKETKLIRQHWDELKSIAEGFVRACEQGDFEKIRRPETPAD